ncbi:hypothetical protein DVH24_015513 [Malus domestica]|uniref:Uncharacterized protein n=1 Tax=Malus domestica TaxID=3750 RepID=A0A498HP02_MALDO|nr:hypothetical protein DVH24_015513 [Malus domestica]
MPYAVSTRAGKEHLMPCAVLTRANENFKPLERLMPCVPQGVLGQAFRRSNFDDFDNHLACFCCYLRLHHAAINWCLIDGEGDSVTSMPSMSKFGFSSKEFMEVNSKEHLMPYAILACAGEAFKPLERLMPCAVLAHAGEDFKPLETLSWLCDI